MGEISSFRRTAPALQEANRLHHAALEPFRHLSNASYNPLYNRIRRRIETNADAFLKLSRREPNRISVIVKAMRERTIPALARLARTKEEASDALHVLSRHPVVEVKVAAMETRQLLPEAYSAIAKFDKDEMVREIARMIMESIHKESRHGLSRLRFW